MNSIWVWMTSSAPRISTTANTRHTMFEKQVSTTLALPWNRLMSTSMQQFAPVRNAMTDARNTCHTIR